MTSKESADDPGGNVNLSLSRFNKLRAPHPVFSSELPEPGSAVVIERFKKELSCKICGYLLKDPVLSRTCMHRFCTGCVVDGSRIIVPACPECGVIFDGNPAFLRDHNFKELIRKLAPKECDTDRRNLFSTLKSTGLDVDNYYRNQGIAIKNNDKIDWTSNHATTSSTEQRKSKPSSSAQGKNYLWRMQVTPKDVIHLNTDNGAIELNIDHLDILPFSIMSVKPVGCRIIPVHRHQTYSLCNNAEPTYTAQLYDVSVPTKLSKELRKLLISMPSFVLKLFPKEFQKRLKLEREKMPDDPLLTHRQLLNHGMLLGLILFPDSSVIKSKVLPKCLRCPRYIYGPPHATINHLREFLYTRALVEADYRARDKFKIEFAKVIREKKQINLRILSEGESGSPTSNGSEQKGEMLFNVRCGPGSGSKVQKRETLIIFKHPFQPLEKHVTIKSIATNSRIIGRPLKIVFCFTPV